MSTLDESTYADAILVVPRLRVQNANAISGPMTWGFPAITAFIGAAWALARRLENAADERLHGRAIRFGGVGVVCHHAQPLVTTGGFTRTFRLTRNPVLADGSTAAIVEEGRIHLDISLVFEVRVRDELLGNAAAEVAQAVADELTRMRIAGGSVMPRLDDPSVPSQRRRLQRPSLDRLHPRTHDERHRQSMRLLRPLLPGFCLVSRTDLLAGRLDELRRADPKASVFDAWLDLSRLTLRSTPVPRSQGDANAAATADPPRGEWKADRREGWIVPIPVGYTSLAPAHPPGEVRGARDPALPARFVESVASIGQWMSPHRLDDVTDLIWRAPAVGSEETLPAFFCRNDFPSSPANRLRRAA